MGCVVFLMRFPFPSSLFLFFHPFPSLLPPLFLPSACLLSVGADNVAAEPLTLANDGGRFMWKVPFRTVLIRSSNWRILLLTWVRELCAVSHNLSQHWTCLSIAKRKFVVENLSSTIWSWKLFLFLLIMVSSWLRLDVQTMSLPKKIVKAALNSWIWVPSPLKSEGTWTNCFNDPLILSKDFYCPSTWIRWQIR